MSEQQSNIHTVFYKEKSLSSTSKILESPSKGSTLLGGLLPEFQILLRKQGVMERYEVNAAKKQINNQSENGLIPRAALSAIQAYGGKVEPHNVHNYLAAKVKHSLNMTKRPRALSPPRNNKKIKTNSRTAKRHHGGHAIRKPKAKPKSKLQQLEDMHETLKIFSQNKKTQMEKNTSPSNNRFVSSLGSQEFEEPDVAVQELQSQVCGIVQQLYDTESLPRPEDQISALIASVGAMDGDTTETGGSPLSPSKMQEVDDLLMRLLGPSELEDPGELHQEISSTSGAAVSPARNKSHLITDIESPVLAYTKPVSISYSDMAKVEALFDRIDQTVYYDANDSDPFLDLDSDGESNDNPAHSTADGECVTGAEDKQKSPSRQDNPHELENSSPKKSNTSLVISSNSAAGYYSCLDSSVDSCDKNLSNAENLTTQMPKLPPVHSRDSGEFHSCSDPSSPKSTSKEDVASTKIRAESPDSMMTKLFPVFLKSASTSSNKSSSPPKCSEKRARERLPAQERDGKEQLLLDAGQKRFGMVGCDQCGFLYDPDDRKDVQAHLTHHNRFDTRLKYKGWRNEKVVATPRVGEKVLLVEPGDPAGWWRRVSQILETVNYDLGFLEEPREQEKKGKAFLYIRGQQVAGFLLAEGITQAHRLLPGEGSLCTEETFPARCGILRIWTSRLARRLGLASILVDTLRANFLINRDLEKSEIAFSSPTADGQAFATRYFGNSEFLVY